MTAVTPGHDGQPVQLRHERRAAARLDVQDDRAHDGGLAGPRSVHDRLPLGAVLLRAAEVERADVRAHVRGRRAARRARPSSRTTPSTRGCRSTSGRRTSSTWRGSSASARRRSRRIPSIALGTESVTPLEEASAYATLAAGGDLLEADGDHEGRARRREGRHAPPAGASRSASASSPTGSRRR